MNSWNFYYDRNCSLKSFSSRAFPNLPRLKFSKMRHFLSLVIIVSLSSCALKKETDQEVVERVEAIREVQEDWEETEVAEVAANQNEVLVEDDMERRCAVFNQSYQATEMSKKANILSLRELDDCLEVTYQYSGCSKGMHYAQYDEVEYDGNQEIKKARFQLFIEGAGDCEMLMEGKAYFKLPVINAIEWRSN